MDYRLVMKQVAPVGINLIQEKKMKGLNKIVHYGLAHG